MKKTVFFLVSFFIISASFTVYYVKNGDYSAKFATEYYNHRKKEKIDRLLAVPILLYHNIDGKGPFSVSLKKLREHFSVIRSQGFAVITLSDLIERMEKGEPYDHPVAVITFDDGYKSMYEKLLPLIKEFGYPVTLFVYTDFVGNDGGKLISWKELAELEASGVDVESHTLSHSDLTKILETGKYEELYKELYISRKMISHKTGRECVYLAFPYGSYNQQLVKYAKLAGYKKVFSTEYGMNLLSSDNFCLRRHHVKSDYDEKKIINILNQNIPE